MSDAYEDLSARLRARPRVWAVTGAAGFIGSHLCERLLALGQRVLGVDDFSTGREENLRAVEAAVGPQAYERFALLRVDVNDGEALRVAFADVDHVLHQAAIGSVPRSIAEPRVSFQANAAGTFSVLEAARAAGVRSLVFASSSAVYGDHPELPKREGSEGGLLSPYAATKATGEALVSAWSSSMGLPAVSLRYFNVIGARQDPKGQYAAVVPRWIAALARGEAPIIFGDGLNSRDFCPVANVVQANLLAAERASASAGRVYNIALGQRTTLLELFAVLRDGMARLGSPCAQVQPRFEDFRAGDIRHSHADIARARDELAYAPRESVASALEAAMRSHLAFESPRPEA